MYMYKLPCGSQQVLFTDKLIFTVSPSEGNNKLLLIANQFAETAFNRNQVNALKKASLF